MGKFRKPKRPQQPTATPAGAGAGRVASEVNLVEWAAIAPHRFVTRSELMQWFQGFERAVIQPIIVNPKLLDIVVIAIKEILAENCQHFVGGRAFGEHHMQALDEEPLMLFGHNGARAQQAQRAAIAAANVAASTPGIAHPSGDPVADVEAGCDDADEYLCHGCGDTFTTAEARAKHIRATHMVATDQTLPLVPESTPPAGIIEPLGEGIAPQWPSALDAAAALGGAIGPLPSEMAVLDVIRFQSAPCYLCGYNGPKYFHTGTHACAARYHEQVRRNANEIVGARRDADGHRV